MSGRESELRVLMAQSGDRAALDALFVEIQAPLFRFVRNIVGQRELAEDVLQNVFVIIYRKLVWLRDPALFRPWAYRIASREAIRRARSERRRREVVDRELLVSLPNGDLADRDAVELSSMLPALLERLSPASRAVVTLHYLEELTLPEVAAVLGIPLGTVKSRLAYGLGLLRRELNQN